MNARVYTKRNETKGQPGTVICEVTMEPDSVRSLLKAALASAETFEKSEAEFIRSTVTYIEGVLDAGKTTANPERKVSNLLHPKLPAFVRKQIEDRAEKIGYEVKAGKGGTVVVCTPDQWSKLWEPAENATA